VSSTTPIVSCFGRCRLLRSVGARVERVSVTALRETTFYAAIAVAVDGQSEEVDAYPSDAINLAVRVGAPIFVDDGVLADQAVAHDELADKLARDAEGKVKVPRGEWSSLSAELLRRIHPK
jgi:bifunctional DNase/RNase